MPIQPLSSSERAPAPPRRHPSLDDFDVHLAFTSTDAVVSLRGDLDARTAPTVHGILRGLVDSGHVSLVIDLAAVPFLGAGGLGVIASAGALARDEGGSLVVRSPSAQTRKIMDITGISGRVVIEEPLGPGGLRSDLIRVVRAPTRNDVTDAKLLGVVALASRAVDGADGVSVSLERNGRLTTVAASNGTVQRMDDHQYETGEGPCMSAAGEGVEFNSDSLASERRWPAFVPRAIGEGIASILSTPLMADERSIGALNIYSNTAHAFGQHQRELAATFANHASDIVRGGEREVTDQDLDVRIDDALRSRETLSLAQGVLMARHAITADEAAAVLHRTARGFGTTALAQAADVVASTADASDDHARVDG